MEKVQRVTNSSSEMCPAKHREVPSAEKTVLVNKTVN